MILKSIKLTLKVITPLFMYGADPKLPELRPSEFKGMMRFWWRAFKATDNIEKLRNEEVGIFGGSRDKEGKSKIILKVNQQPLKTDQGYNLKKDFNLIWSYNRNIHSLDGKDAGIGYLLYSAVLHNREKSYIKPNYHFNIELFSEDERAFDNALASLWAAIYLGGFGTRARRGAGNVVVEDIVGNCKLDFIPKGNSPNELYFWIKSNVDRCFSIINDVRVKNFCTKFSNLSFSRLIIGNQVFTDWRTALNDIGQIYLRFRASHRRDIFNTAVFGLPVMHRNVNVIGFKENEKISRRSSPVIIKVVGTTNNFFWYVIRLSGEFFEEGAVIKAQGKQRPSYKLIDKFWNQLKTQGKEFIISQPEILVEIIEKIKKGCNPDKIILFGSRARGDAHKNADIDIALINPKAPIGNLNLYAPLDIVDLSKANTVLRNKINSEGVVIYERTS